MQRINHFLVILSISFFTGSQIHAQCIPDTSCKDIALPGEFCPKKLPDAVVNEAYEAVITVIPPDTFTYGESTITIVYIEIDSVLNLPEGISYTPNAEKFYPDSTYCILVSGTPVEEGDYQLGLYVSPFINYLNTVIKGTQVVDDTSVVMTVLGPSNLDPYQVKAFRVLQNVPNPFSEVTRMGFYTPFDDRIELKVYNILGELMHQEIQGAPPGEHYFSFDGRDLLPGTYFYRVTNSSDFHTGKFIKSR